MAATLDRSGAWNLAAGWRSSGDPVSSQPPSGLQVRHAGTAQGDGWPAKPGYDDPHEWSPAMNPFLLQHIAVQRMSERRAEAARRRLLLRLRSGPALVGGAGVNA